MLSTMSIVVALACARTPPRPEIVELFEPVTSTSPVGPLRYRLFRPRHETSLKRPLLVWLHGRGEAGNNNQDQLAWLELLLGQDRRKATSFPAYVLALQCPADASDWSARQRSSSDPLDAVQWVLNDLVRRLAIDERRIYLAGISCGASACWELANRDPGRFAALVPFATTSWGTYRPQNFVKTPIWAFQATGDGQASCAQTQQMIQRIRLAGGRAHLTVVDLPGHDCWTTGFNKYHASDWILAQRQGDRHAPTPGSPPGKLRARSACVIGGGLLLIAGWCAFRSRERSVRDDSAPVHHQELADVNCQTNSSLSKANRTSFHRRTLSILWRHLANMEDSSMSSKANPEDKLELTPEEARMVIKAIEDAEREEAAEQEKRASEKS